jgi:hypothetical protein
MKRWTCGWRIAVMAVFTVIVFSFTVLPVSAALTSNLIVNGGFDIAVPFTGVNSAIPLVSGTWYTSQTASTNDWQKLALDALLWSSTGGGRTGTLIQTVNVPEASYGPVEFKFVYNVPNTNGTAMLYGSDTQPSYGSYGTQIGTTINLTGLDGWQYVTETFGGASYSGYDWYTVVFYGSVPNKDKVYLDTMSLKVSQGTQSPVPLPGAVWLLGSSLMGLIAIRRRFKK